MAVAIAAGTTHRRQNLLLSICRAEHPDRENDLHEVRGQARQGEMRFRGQQSIVVDFLTEMPEFLIVCCRPRFLESPVGDP